MNTFLWVKHLFLYTFVINISTVTMCFLSHCFFAFNKLLSQPLNLSFCPSLARWEGWEGVAYLEFNSWLVLHHHREVQSFPTSAENPHVRSVWPGFGSSVLQGWPMWEAARNFPLLQQSQCQLAPGLAHLWPRPLAAVVLPPGKCL